VNDLRHPRLPADHEAQGAAGATRVFGTAATLPAP
jgi:hypothetical protein